jgi:hypothetical protein
MEEPMMAYANGFVAVVLDSTGKPIRELNENNQRTVRLPFGSEYRLRLKNNTGSRAWALIDIDGMDALSGSKLLLRPGQTLDVERFLEGDNNKGARFKFVEAGSAGVTDPTSGENGRIRVTFEPEYVWPVTFTTSYTPPGATCGGTYTTLSGSGGTITAKGLNLSANCVSSNSAGLATSGSCYINNASIGATNATNSVASELGATVQGSQSNQAFQDTAESFSTTTPVIIDIWMRGPKVEVEAPYKFDMRSNPPYLNGVMLQGVEWSITSGELCVKLPLHKVDLVR